MPRQRKEIPFFDVNIKGLKTLLEEGKTQQEMADYYGVGKATINRRLKELKESQNV